MAGCNHNCKGCHNPETWDCNAGTRYTEEVFRVICEELDKPYIRGLSLSGGDPLYPNNRRDIFALVKRVKKLYPKKDIWCWTGYSWEEIKGLELLKYIDVLVDGLYIEEKRDITLAWRGSSNQRVIDVPKSLGNKRVESWCD